MGIIRLDGAKKNPMELYNKGSRTFKYTKRLVNLCYEGL